MLADKIRWQILQELPQIEGDASERVTEILNNMTHAEFLDRLSDALELEE